MMLLQVYSSAVLVSVLIGLQIVSAKGNLEVPCFLLIAFTYLTYSEPSPFTNLRNLAGSIWAVMILC